jgi:hypothetical protein
MCMVARDPRHYRGGFRAGVARAHPTDVVARPPRRRRSLMLRTLILGPALLVGLLAPIWAPPAAAQQIFHSSQSANLPTTETLREGNWLFEISHRFVPPVSDGANALWGLDGPSIIRLGLSHSPMDGVLIGIQRTNADDNLELNAKAVVLEHSSEGFALDVGAMAGVAWNLGLFEVDGAVDNESQLYAQMLVDAKLGSNLAVGVVPTWLRNPRLKDFDAANAFTLGLHGQAYLTRSVSLLGEWIFSERRADLENDSGTFGIELQTRGHYFKLLVTNQYLMNPTQVLAGSPNPFELDQLRFGFNLTRLLPF